MTWWKSGESIGDDWTLGDCLVGPDGRALEHVRAATRDDGQRGVAKKIRGGGRPGVNRFRLVAEIEAMRALRHDPGILPALHSSTVDPVFVVTPQAVLLEEHLGQTPDLREVVQAFFELARTLARLHDSKLFHRDIKPANLFWFNDSAVFGDFGLVHDAAAENAKVTASTDLIGSIYFMAPECRTPADVRFWAPADVYSLAMCLWAIAQGKKWPIHSTLWGREPSVSLYRAGGKAADDLAALLEAATRERAHERPSARFFAEELGCWLSLHQEAPRPNRPPKYQSFGEFMETRVHQEGIEGKARRSLSELALEVRRSLLPVFGEVDHSEESATVLNPPDITGGDPDFLPEWGPVTVTRTFANRPGVRLVLEMVGLDNEMGVYLVEWQGVDSAGKWSALWTDDAAIRSLPRFPSDRDIRNNVLAPSLVAHAPSSA